MIKARAFGKMLRWFMTLALPFLLSIASLRLLLSYEFLRFEYTRPGFPSDPYGMTSADRLEFGMHAIGWLFSADDLKALARLRLPADKCWLAAPGAVDCPLFNAKELWHLADVKQILHIAFALAGACHLILIAVAAMAWRRQWTSAATTGLATRASARIAARRLADACPDHLPGCISICPPGIWLLTCSIVCSSRRAPGASPSPTA